MTTEQKKFIDGIGACELCGSKRNLQLHHMIPMACENKFIDLDIEDNWLCVCGACHAKLTPKNLLTKYGIAKVKINNEKILDIQKKLDFAKWIEAEIDDYVTLKASEIHNSFVELFLPEYYGSI